VNNTEVLNNMMKRLGNRTAPTLRATVLLELNQKIRQLEQGATIPWFLEDRWDDVCVSAQDFLPLPADFLREVEEGQFRVQNINASPVAWANVVKSSYEKVDEAGSSVDPALPLVYALFGVKVYFAPTPDVAYPIRLPYYKRTAEITDTNDVVSNLWLTEFYNFVTLSTLDIVAATHIRDAKLRADILPELQVAADDFWRSVEARQHVNRDYLLDDTEN